MSDVLRTIVVDDEPLARQRMRGLLTSLPGVELVAECASAAEAEAAVTRERPDLLMLDIAMPEVDGFGLLQALGDRRPPAVVFVTAHDEHALRAFEVHALDYLLKPFDRERLSQAIERARHHRERGNGDLEEKLRALLSDLGRAPAGGYLERLVVRTGGKISFVRTEEIDWIEAAGNYARLHLGRESHLIRDTMNALEKKLDPKRFQRIHRSTIVQVDRIKELQHVFHGDYSVQLRDGTRLTLSRGYREQFERAVAGSTFLPETA
ncbi:MAG: LytTR family DNA-binding domain-containing protein [Thermoanaerobaculia bacterium]